MRKAFLSFVLLFMFSLQAQAALIWGTDASDELTGTRYANDDIFATGAWDDNFAISWDVAEVDGGWVYGYSIDDNFKDISHLNIEVTFDNPEPLIGHNGEFLDPEWILADHPSNPGMPEDIFGVKFDDGVDHISFFSDRAPVYGNFYAKSGWDSDSEEWTYAYNHGLADPLSMNRYDFIVRPNGVIVTPEPAASALMALGVGGVVLARRRRSKK
jgi:hypothetical protein